jgi:hypothetical protein
MVQGRGSLRLSLKTTQCLAVASNFFWQEFEGNESVQARIFGLIDHAHATAAQLLDDTVVRDGLTDHSPEILGSEIGQVNEGKRLAGVSSGWLS